MALPIARYVLAPVLPAALIAAPAASFLASSLGLSWTPTFLLGSGALVGLWAGVRLREDLRSQRAGQIEDPCFGKIERRGSGPWWGSVALQDQPGLLPISIDAGRAGPSERQRQRFLDLKERFAELQEPLRALLGAQVDGAQAPERSQLLSLELLGDDRDSAFVTAWSVLLEDGGSAVFNIPLEPREQASDQALQASA